MAVYEGFEFIDDPWADGRRVYPAGAAVFQGAAYPTTRIQEAYSENRVFVSVSGEWRSAPTLFCARLRNWRAVSSAYVAIGGQWRVCDTNIPQQTIAEEFYESGEKVM